MDDGPRPAPCSTRSWDAWPPSPPTAHTIRRVFPPRSPSVIRKRRSFVPPRSTAVPSETAEIAPTATRPPSSVHHRTRTRNLAEDLRIHEAGPSRGGHRQVQAGDRRRAALAHGPAPGDRGGPRRPCPQPCAGAGTPDLRPHRLISERGWGNCVRTPGPCNSAARACPTRHRVRLERFAHHLLRPSQDLQRPMIRNR